MTSAFFNAALSSALLGGMGGVLIDALALAAGGIGVSDPPQPTALTNSSTADPAATIALRIPLNPQYARKRAGVTNSDSADADWGGIR